LDDPLWQLLNARGKTDCKSISEPVCKAVPERYLGKHDERLMAMLASR